MANGILIALMGRRSLSKKKSKGLAIPLRAIAFALIIAIALINLSNSISHLRCDQLMFAMMALRGIEINYNPCSTYPYHVMKIMYISFKAETDRTIATPFYYYYTLT